MLDHFCKGRKWFLAIVAGALGTLTAGQAAHAQGTWTALTPVSPSPMEGMTVGGVGQIIVAAYGFSPVPGNTNQTLLYNINTNLWSTGAPAPLPARAEAAYGETTHGGFLYVIGGGNSGVALSDLQRYDPVLDAWTTLASMNTARAGAAAAVIDDGIFVFGGCTGAASAPSFTGEVDMYDPQTNTWTTLPSTMTTARASLVAGHSGDKVYTIGGTTDGVSVSNVNEVYDIPSGTWSTNTATMTTARQEAGVSSHGGKIYVVGGSTASFGTSTAAN